jgi:chromosomal replication initiator protein
MSDMSGSEFGKAIDVGHGSASQGPGGEGPRTTGVTAEQFSASIGAVAARAVMDEERVQRTHKRLRATLGEEVYTSWFNALELDIVDGPSVRWSVPVKFLKTWIQTHYTEQLLAACKSEFTGIERVEVVLREPGQASAKAQALTRSNTARSDGQQLPTTSAPAAATVQSRPVARYSGPQVKTSAGGVEGSPLDPRYTFDSFMIGTSNRMAQAAAKQVADTVFSENRQFNPLCIHASVGLGKTHLLHAIAWEVRRRTPHAQVLYLTAERFRLQFVEALRSQDPMSFKDKFRQIDILLIDDLEFLHGHQTEQEFDHVINTLLDGGRQVVVASARPPSHIERLNERMRSRLQRGLVTEIKPLDQELRLRVLERRVEEKRSMDPSFEVPHDVLELFSERLSDSGRELEGAITRLHCQWQYMKTAVTFDMAETMIRDLVHGTEPKRIKIDDILKIVARHYGVSRADLLSQRRHRSVVWPRQIGMYLAKQMTSRSLPEIGRRFGDRDHTTVLHAIRKIDKELEGNTRLRDELEELKKQIGP